MILGRHNLTLGSIPSPWASSGTNFVGHLGPRGGPKIFTNKSCSKLMVMSPSLHKMKQNAQKVHLGPLIWDQFPELYTKGWTQKI